MRQRRDGEGLRDAGNAFQEDVPAPGARLAAGVSIRNCGEEPGEKPADEHRLTHDDPCSFPFENLQCPERVFR